jgi:GT2 family glycosyltransferase
VAAREEGRGVSIGAVIIGRNEGERLARCLRSLAGRASPLVYVDSGSSDGSCELAASMGAEVVRLDMSSPFSAARARNAGLERVCQLDPGAELVQFVDGDCELAPGWTESARAEMERWPAAAAVCGRVRERHPESSVYNRLCDIEFTRSPGEVDSCGGIFMGRVAAMREVGGFNPAVVAGEEPELCLRLRRAGYTIVRLADEMAWHDSAMMRLGQWWRRSVRSGHAYAQGMMLHGRGPERFCVRESARIWLWAVGVPVGAAALAWPTWGMSLLMLSVYPLQVVRTARGRKEPSERRGDAWLYGTSCVLVKWPQAVGQGVYWARALLGRTPRIIEHKGPALGGGARVAAGAAGDHRG